MVWNEHTENDGKDAVRESAFENFVFWGLPKFLELRGTEQLTIHGSKLSVNQEWPKCLL